MYNTAAPGHRPCCYLTLPSCGLLLHVRTLLLAEQKKAPLAAATVPLR
jgi:hypothetical protein